MYNQINVEIVIEEDYRRNNVIFSFFFGIFDIFILVYSLFMPIFNGLIWFNTIKYMKITNNFKYGLLNILYYGNALLNTICIIHSNYFGNKYGKKGGF